jgi:hypothetical protein
MSRKILLLSLLGLLTVGAGYAIAHTAVVDSDVFIDGVNDPGDDVTVSGTLSDGENADCDNTARRLAAGIDFDSADNFEVLGATTADNDGEYTISNDNISGDPNLLDDVFVLAFPDESPESHHFCKPDLEEELNVED